MKNLYLLLLFTLVLFSCKNESDPIPVLTPNAIFTYTINPSNYKSVNFLNASKSIHTQSKYYWFFGDGDSSSQENPIHEYKMDGYYNVVLRVANKELMDSYSCQIKISNVMPDSNLSVPQLSFVYSQKERNFTFQNTSSGPKNGIEYYWNFGENTTFIKADENGNVAYTFSKDGAFSVVLKALFNNTVYCISKNILVSANYQPVFDSLVPVPSFSYHYNSDGTLSFINTSSFVSADTKYSWYFFEGLTSALENPANIDFNDGTYDVVLKVTNGNYSVSCERQIEVPKIDKPIALFVYNQNGMAAKFVNASSNVNKNTSYEWYFGDGESSLTEENPTHIYDNSQSGKTLKVILKVVNQTKSDVFTSEIKIP